MAGIGITLANRFRVSASGHRFFLRSPHPEDADSYVQYVRRNWERFRGSMPTPDDRTFCADAVGRRFAAPQDNVLTTLVIAESDHETIVGDLTFSGIVMGPFQACYLGFKVDEQYEGLGVLRHALEIKIAEMFDVHGLHRIMANYRPENLRSGGLLRRLDFQVEGFARDYLHLDGAWRDHILTALTRR